MINSVVIVGRVGQDPEMKYFESGKVKTSFSVAVNRWTKEGDKTDWYNIELWDKSAEIAGEYVKKGRQVAVEGRLDVSQWTDSDGNKRERYFVRGTNLRLLGGKSDTALMN
jgi:single-strand DNA-binding protein